MTAENTSAAKDSDRKQVYKITIDKVHFDVLQPLISGAALLQLAGKVPVDQFGVYIKRKGAQPERIGLDEDVDLREPGVEHFVTLPLDQTEG
ncbi:MAG: multiubiquitin domain-containing protein [Hydrogenophaga sp.]|uniref:multiubiquitin domain-containing protein n=1 Tax=Hydrogenophaga sp. TaxID=1904254 RepID=UPI001D728270|nr:multiubiquitin domain-containing protein [Hydrogenophaga sp.]MBX3608647.1 multiubiquitin domain-containing protein [Hydrogenophaga sp.]